MSFQDKTRRRIIKIAAKAKGSETPLTFKLDKAGILAGIYLKIKGTLTGTLSAPNALGKACIIKRVRLAVNSGHELHSYSGIQYHYLIRDNLENFVDVVPHSDARSAVAAGAYDLSMWLPVAINQRDPIGLFQLQSEQTEMTLTVEFEDDAVIATGITAHTCTVQPVMVIFSTPPDQKDWPDFSILHAIVAESRSIVATGEIEHIPLRGHTYLGLYMGYGLAVSGSDKFSQVQIQAMGSDAVETWDPDALSLNYTMAHGRARLPGAIPIDWLGSSGLGSYGSARDAIPSGLISNLKVLMTVTTQPDTWHIVRRQLIRLA